jgi:single-stranded-DNA-specific exonuclease
MNPSPATPTHQACRLDLPDRALEAQARTLSRERGLTPAVARILAGRGIVQGDAIDGLLVPRLDRMHDPYLLPDMETAVVRLAAAIRAGEAIGVFGDYDVDGVTGSAILTEFLRTCGAAVHTYLPDRLKEGYGLNSLGLERLAALGVKVVVTVDCGINARQPAQRALELGIDLIITDHHEVEPPLPAALAVVNPKVAGSAYPFAEIAGVGVAFNLLVALRRHLLDTDFFPAGAAPDLKGLLDIVALGTIGDMVPLVDVNRAWVRRGLQQLNRRQRPGFRALTRAAGIPVKPLTAGQVAFQLAPRINALGRLGDPAAGVALLTTPGEGEADRLADLCEGENRRRRAIEASIVEQAIAQVEDHGGPRRGIVVSSPQWHPGVVGIVASRLVERYHRPTTVLAEMGDRARGSVRTIAGVDIHRVLSGFADQLDDFGGHPYAAGLTIRTSRIPALADFLHDALERGVAPERWQRAVRIDCELPFAEIDFRLLEELKGLEPFGVGNPEPLFLTRGVTLQRLRRIGDGSHLSMVVTAGGFTYPGVWFRHGNRYGELAAGGAWDLVYQLKLDDWRDAIRIQLLVKEVLPS